MGGDWTKNNLRSVSVHPVRYNYYGATAKAENTHFPNEKHGYEYIKRQAMYPFMVKHLGLDSKGVFNKKLVSTRNREMLLNLLLNSGHLTHMKKCPSLLKLP